MSLRFGLKSLLMLFAFLFVAQIGGSTVVSGNLTYDGSPVSAVFSEIGFGSVSAYNVGNSERTYGSVNIEQGTYSVELEEGIYNFSIVLGEDENTDSTSYLPGNLWGTKTNIAVGSGSEQTVDFPMYYFVHVVAPFDNEDFGAQWGGSALECPYGPEVTPQFRLEWDPVPGVNRYEVLVQYFSCDALVQDDAFPTTNTFLDMVINPAVAENISFFVRGHGSSVPPITAMPYLIYGNTGTNSHWLHAAAGEGRPIHSTDSLFLLQVANLPGVGSSYWTSDVTLSNTGPSDVLAKLTMTPRGANGLADYTTKTYQVPAHSCRTIKDVVGSLFGASGAGSLEIAPSTLRAYARLATAGEEGSYGQSFPSAAVNGESWASLAGGKIIRAAGIIKGPFRTNLILAEIWGEPADVEVSLIDMNGVQLGETAIAIPAYGNIQINDVVRVLTGSAGLELHDAQVAVSVRSGGGRVAGALSLVDQESDDPVTIILE